MNEKFGLVNYFQLTKLNIELALQRITIEYKLEDENICMGTSEEFPVARHSMTSRLRCLWRCSLVSLEITFWGVIGW